LLALLAGLAFYRARQRKKSSQVDSSFLESRMQPDSFFGSSGGQRIDTADEAPTGSSLAYSPSQLDAAGDVDPVAEADVYLAYGRDLQAEEILKEALRMNPSRIAIHGKLLEIFAKRRNVRAFEALAGDAFKLCAGEGAEWERICEFGRELDHDNPLYQPGGRPKNKAGTADAKEPVAPFFASSTIPVAPHPDFAPSSSMPVDLDLGDLFRSIAPPRLP
jgi:pilus assembly protein FimV